MSEVPLEEFAPGDIRPALEITGLLGRPVAHLEPLEVHWKGGEDAAS